MYVLKFSRNREYLGIFIVRASNWTTWTLSYPVTEDKFFCDNRSNWLDLGVVLELTGFKLELGWDGTRLLVMKF